MLEDDIINHCLFNCDGNCERKPNCMFKANNYDETNIVPITASDCDIENLIIDLQKINKEFCSSLLLKTALTILS